MPPSNGKYVCTNCDFVWKGRGGTCPGGKACREAGYVKSMGTKWRPGRKGSRTRMWDRRQAGPPRLISWRPGEWEQRDKLGRKHLRALREEKERLV